MPKTKVLEAAGVGSPCQPSRVPGGRPTRAPSLTRGKAQFKRMNLRTAISY